MINPPGTKGDRLILMGMEKKLKELDIRYRCFDLNYVNSIFFKRILSLIYGYKSRKINLIIGASLDVLLLRGGGYLNDIWKDYNFLNIILQAVCDKPETIIIIAPSSFYFTTTYFHKFFDRIENKVHIFCREMYSYDRLKSMVFPKNVHIHLSPDTSFYLTREDFPLQNKEESYILIAPRKDCESVVTWKIDKMISKTKILFGDIIHLPKFQDYINIIWNARQIYTDRLHNAILAAILGKETYLYPNLYHKNKGVYEFSLRKFPNVKFVDSYKFLGLNACS
ncbi:MAG: polysaccharide pyruvyl transferase family protein [Nitrososphaerota archaeon]